MAVCICASLALSPPVFSLCSNHGKALVRLLPESGDYA